MDRPYARPFHPDARGPSRLLGHSGAFVSRLTNAGEFVWAKRLGGSDSDTASDVAVDSVANIYTGGRFAETADFDAGPGTYGLVSAGGADAFISKLSQLLAPSETGNAGFTDKSTWRWDPAVGAATYNIYRSGSSLPGTFGCVYAARFSTNSVLYQGRFS